MRGLNRAPLGASLTLSQRLAERSYRSILEDQFNEQLQLFAAHRALRLDAVRTALVDATRNPRLKGGYSFKRQDADFQNGEHLWVAETTWRF